ncbi:hypothetical protein ACXEO8_07025 [Cytobacillus firmus]
MAGWKNQRPRQLKKIAYALTEPALMNLVQSHEERGWVQASEVKEHGYGFGILLTFGEKGEIAHASNSKSAFQ